MHTTVLPFALAATLIAVPSLPSPSHRPAVPLAQAQAAVAGNTQTYGPANEVCQTNGTVLEPTDSWERIIEHSPPGATYLLRGGTYSINTTLIMPAGLPGRSITVKPYDCEAVTMKSTHSGSPGNAIMPRSHNVFAGLRIVADHTPSLVRIDGKNLGFIEDVVFRNNILTGGQSSVFNINTDAHYITIVGNVIDGVAKDGSVIRIGRGTGSVTPSHINIDRNRISKAYFGNVGAGDDVIEVTAADHLVISNNLFTEAYNIENVIDLKLQHSSVPVVIDGNHFEANHLGTFGGDDSNSICLIIGDPATVAKRLRHLIRNNTFVNCRGGAIAIGGGNRKGSAWVENNIFYHDTNTLADAQGGYFNADDTLLINNTFYRGGFKIGWSRASCNSLPQGLIIKNNIFYETRIQDQTDRCPSIDYQLVYNLWNNLPSKFERGVQKYNKTGDPLFISPSKLDFRLKNGSPAQASGAGEVDMGVLYD
jgi:hypothetical protein